MPSSAFSPRCIEMETTKNSRRQIETRVGCCAVTGLIRADASQFSPGAHTFVDGPKGDDTNVVRAHSRFSCMADSLSTPLLHINICDGKIS